jgi:HSP20 family protein
MFWPTTYPTFKEMARLLDEYSRSTGFETGRRENCVPRLNAYSNEDGLLLTLEVPGVEPKELEISVRDHVLTIKGEVPAHPHKEGESFLRSERRTGSFLREVTLPFRVTDDHVKAEYRHGVVKLAIAKPEEEKPRRIAIQAA